MHACRVKTNSIEKKIMCIFKAVIAGLFFAGGCVPGPLVVTREDVSNQEQLWYGYKRDGKYRLAVNVFLRVREDVPTPNKTVLVAPREKTLELCSLSYSSPYSLGDYYNNKERWSDVEGVVGEGTIIQCSRMLKLSSLGYGSSLYIYAKIIEGPFKGIEAEISDLSISEYKLNLYLKKPNLKLLSETEDAGK